MLLFFRKTTIIANDFDTCHNPSRDAFSLSYSGRGRPSSVIILMSAYESKWILDPSGQTLGDIEEPLTHLSSNNLPTCSMHSINPKPMKSTSSDSPKTNGSPKFSSTIQNYNEIM